MTDLNVPLSEAERSELALNDFVRNLVYRSGKYTEESDFQNFEPQHQNPQWLHLEQLMRAVRLEREVCEEVDRLGEFLDFPSYIQIVQDYFRFYPLVNERKKVVVAIIHLMVFSRLYARRLRRRMQVAGANEALAQRNLDHLIVYTVLAIQHLLQNGLHIHWNQFCEEAVGYEIIQKSSHFPSTTTIATVCVAAIGVGFLMFAIRNAMTRIISQRSGNLRFHSHSKRRLTTEKRGDYSFLEESDLKYFEKQIGKQNVLVEDLESYNVDWMKWYTGHAKCVLTPESAEHVSAILRHCHSRRLAVVPQSGNTGLVGGSVPVFDEIVLSTRKLNRHFKLYPSSGIVECDAGFVLHELDERLEPHGYIMPIDLGARGSCYIGGNIATNAGGIRLIRYGSLHGNVLALQVVIPDEHGTILELGSNLRKDNSDLKTYQLFIGSEGQLGIITRASILVTPKPTSVSLAFLGTNSFKNCTEILRIAKQFLGEILSSFELMDAESMRSIKENVGMESVLKSNPAFNLLVEISGSNQTHDSEKMENFLSHCLENDLAQDGIMAESGADSAYLWKLRENASLALNFDGYVYKHDLSLPLDHFYELSDVVRERLKGTEFKRVVTFGHVGDGNTHLNVTAANFDQEIYERLYPFIYEWVHTHGGSISAEHGIGRLKRPYHHNFASPASQRINSQIKRAFDPRGILSPYKMID